MKWKKYWGMIPFTIFLFLQLCIMLIESLTESTLRSKPKLVLFWVALISCLILILWIGSIFFRRHRMRSHLVLKNIMLTIYIVFAAAMMCIGIFISAFMYKPEHVIKRDGIRMVANVNSFLQETVYYYEYKNFLFRGAEQIGWEDYGNGGGDPFEQEREPERWYFKETDGNAIE